MRHVTGGVRFIGSAAGSFSHTLTLTLTTWAYNRACNMSACPPCDQSPANDITNQYQKARAMSELADLLEGVGGGLRVGCGGRKDLSKGGLRAATREYIRLGHCNHGRHHSLGR